MNDIAKNIILWVVIAVVLLSVFNSFGNSARSTRTLEYSTFVQKVRSDEVKTVEFKSDGVSIGFDTESGEHFVTYNPESDNSHLIGDLLQVLDL